MKKDKKKFGETDFGQFLSKVGGVLPEVGEVALSIVGGNYVGAVAKVGGMLKKGAENNKEAKVLLKEFEMFEMTYEKECFELEKEDRESARELFKDDSIIQKIFAVTFLVGYIAMCYYMLQIIKGEATENELFKTMVTMIFTGTSTKLGTIIDFFFGGSVK